MPDVSILFSKYVQKKKGFIAALVYFYSQRQKVLSNMVDPVLGNTLMLPALKMDQDRGGEMKRFTTLISVSGGLR